ncbi:MAG: hypothetical protein KAI38_07580 [Candidatus Latescibacteria bacterium]|nr:hypothetical protein [Candidatus Latescibacterota bacterium]
MFPFESADGFDRIYIQRRLALYASDRKANLAHCKDTPFFATGQVFFIPPLEAYRKVNAMEPLRRSAGPCRETIHAESEFHGVLFIVPRKSAKKEENGRFL